MAVLYLFLIAAAVFWLLLYLIYREAFHSPRKADENIFNIPANRQYNPHREFMMGLIRDLDNRPFEPVTIRSRDGLTLFGRYYHYADGAPLDIAFHGYRGTAMRDMCGGIRLSYAVGHNILLVDQRAHGGSTGHCITFGIKERWDCLSWVEYARQRFGADTSILLYGVSMGAATVLMASDLDFGGSVRGIIADCPYSSPKEIIRKVCGDRHYPAAIAMPLVKLAARIFAGFDLEEITATEAVGRSGIPIIILHGEEDRFVPPEMSREIADARSDVERYEFPDAGHGMSAIVQADAYNEAVLNFMRKYCP